jgi:hypothetical protein
VLFQRYNHLAKEERKSHNPDEQARAQQKMFAHRDEQAEIAPRADAGASPEQES